MGKVEGFFAYCTMLFCLLFCCSGCSRVQYVPVETVRTDSIYLSKYLSDSTYLKDSIFIMVDMRTDTVVRTEFRQSTIYRDRWRIDTVYSEKVDTVRVPYPVERELTRWQRWKLNLGGYCMVAVIVTVIVVVGRMVYRLIK